MKKKLLTTLLSVFVMITTFTASVFADGNEAIIGSTGYPTLQAAIDAVNNGETIVINKSEICYDTPITINNGKTFTIDFMNGSTQCVFRWYDMNGAQREKDIFTVGGNSNVTVKNMQYKIGIGERGNRIFKVNSTGTLTLTNMICGSGEEIIKDTPVVNNGGTSVFKVNAQGGSY